MTRSHPSKPIAPSLVAAALLAAAALMLAALGGQTAYAANDTSPLGLWKTFDDKTGKPKGIVRIYEDNGALFGKIERSFVPNADTRTCVLCTDERKNQPIIGLVIMRNMKPAGDAWAGGDILDPESGSVYHCTIRLENGGARLVVRGYIGMPLLGRSQNWERQD